MNKAKIIPGEGDNGENRSPQNGSRLCPEENTYNESQIQVLEGLEAVRNARECILAPPSRDFTTLYTKLWTTLLTKRLPASAPR